MSGLPDTIGQTVGNMMAGAIGGGVPTRTVQPKNIQIPALDLSEISGPYINVDGSVSSASYTATGVSGVLSNGTVVPIKPTPARTSDAMIEAIKGANNGLNYWPHK